MVTKNNINTAITDNLVLDNPSFVNEGNLLMMDMNLMCFPNGNKYPMFKNYNFKTNSNLYVSYQLFANKVIPTTQLYSPSIVERWNTFVYYPNTLVYLLISKNPYKIYIMQVFKNINNSINEINYLEKYLDLPEGWTYCYLKLNCNQYLTINAYGDAEVISDNLFNAYQYIKQECNNKWLYNKYA